jgi:hypothetical protein
VPEHGGVVDAPGGVSVDKADAAGPDKGHPEI